MRPRSPSPQASRSNLARVRWRTTCSGEPPQTISKLRKQPWRPQRPDGRECQRRAGCGQPSCTAMRRAQAEPPPDPHREPTRERQTAACDTPRLRVSVVRKLPCQLLSLYTVGRFRGGVKESPGRRSCRRPEKPKRAGTGPPATQKDSEPTLSGQRANRPFCPAASRGGEPTLNTLKRKPSPERSGCAKLNGGL